MRKIGAFEAYLDRPDTITIYMNELHYGGVSSSFVLFDELDQSIPLEIISTTVGDDHYHTYQCQFTNPLQYGRHYDVVDCHGRVTPLWYGQVIKSKHFNDLFTTKRPLGAYVENGATTFTVWAPTSSMAALSVLNEDGVNEVHWLNRCTDGTFSITLNKNYHKCRYYYIVKNNGKIRQIIDPYGIASTPNGRFSVVVDESKLSKTKVKVKPIKHANDAIIYECNIRDLTPEHTFKALCTNRKYVLDYIKDLGVTHLQIMPVLDYGSVDETNVNRLYNWGYDTDSWFGLENSYSSNPYDPIQVIEDFKEFVNTVHSMGMKVIVDVVYNHVFELKTSAYYNICPYYFFQIDSFEVVSNSSGCGNDIDSTQPMVQRFILDSIAHLFSWYDIDGIRLDLMGILDYQTVNQIHSLAVKYKKDALVYGEGWNMPSYLEESKRASINNASKTPQVGYFSDILRDSIKGSLFGNDFNGGFACANAQWLHKCMNSLQASVLDFGYRKVFVNVTQAINYTECHDNMTVYDQYHKYFQESEEQTLRRCLLTLTITILAQGIPFIHSGQEFARTKNGVENSYDKGDDINRMDWARAKANGWMVDYVRNVINIRKKYPHFHLEQDIGSHVYFEHVDGKLLMYEIEVNDSTLIIFFNPTYHTYHYHFQFGMQQILDEQGSLETVDNVFETSIAPISTKIFAYKKKD